MSEKIDLVQASKFVRGLSSELINIAQRFYRSSQAASEKAKFDVLTEADLEIESFLKAQLIKKFPQSSFLMEESASGNFSEFMELDSLWVVDPIDGTGNLARRHPNFATSIALVSRGIPQLGVVIEPMSERVSWAQADLDGAFTNGKHSSVSSVDQLEKAVVAFDFGRQLDKRLENVEWLMKVYPYIGQIKAMGSAVSDITSVARGQIEAYWNNALYPWDVAAAGLIAQKAGGRVTRYNGDSWNVFSPDILVTNGVLHLPILEAAK